MVVYKPAKGIGILYILGMMIFYDALIVLGIAVVNSYVLISLLKVFLALFSIYHIYYILICTTLKYGIDNNGVYITHLFKKIRIPFDLIDNYSIEKGKIYGVRLSGFGTNSFALGKSVIKNIGTTNIFVTSNKNVFYIKTGEVNYAFSPLMVESFEGKLKEHGIQMGSWKNVSLKHVSLHKDKTFMVPFISVSLIITILTLNPFILYLANRLPGTMPLNFDAAFLPVEYGTGKQFAFNQMVYGVLNMAVLFCMYYASHFYAKYDRKSAKKFIFISLIIALAFLLIQFRILYTFR